jgi:hypothetical protein
MLDGEGRMNKSTTLNSLAEAIGDACLCGEKLILDKDVEI